MGGDRLIITGASGKLARSAAEIVLESHPADALILVTRTPAALASFAARGAAVRFGDFAAPESLRDAFAGGERMLLVSATDLERRTAQHRAAIAAARAAGVRHIVYTSGLAPAPPNPAAVSPSHFATEQALAASGLDFTVLRNSLYSEYQLTEAEQALAAGRLVHNRGAGRVAYVSREDCAAAAAAVLTADGHAGAIYDITGPTAYTAAELAALYGDLAGRPVQEVSLDDAAFVATLVGAAGADDHLKFGAELVASFGRAIREGYLERCTTDVERLTGRPARRLEDVLEPLRRGE